MIQSYDLAIIGAGPAGMAAAIEADAAGLTVALIDEQPAPGGQIYRSVEAADHQRLAVLGKDYAAGLDLVAAFRASGITYIPSGTVWNIEDSYTIDYARAGTSDRISAKSVLVASGAVERAMPLPGWTLPGVTTAGALQILLKAHGAINDDVVLAGSGPLIYLIAFQMIKAGAPPRAIVDMGQSMPVRAVLNHLPGALKGWRYLAKGLRLLRDIKKADIPFYHKASNVRIEGEGSVQGISFDHRGRPIHLATSSVALHQGVVPNQQITRLLRCKHEWNGDQRCFVPVLDHFGESSVPGVFVAGDGAGIAGAVSAALRGRIAALKVAERSGRGNGERLTQLIAELGKDSAVRPLLESIYAPSEEVLFPDDKTIVCRCEEVTAGDIRRNIALGVQGPNQLKSFLRCGMGPCQGRVCGLPVTEIIARERGEDPQTIDYYRIRPPLKPLVLSELAAVHGEGAMSNTKKETEVHD
ncbi:FAD/NAD(P)-dependent oxidoreductase [Agrobacterium vitis]|uniref:FAD/NAD(P)-dependent oxidoreductase n=1 Tax=Agrobacterium vitis TaxID=373 RepID=UPI0015742192|nr:NAD(P)/FAD-dependent oxidoreductase [Agrobacterium vitis]NSZ19688.1 FAD-dependent oxidoreductase [Agrobacterium vitis]QZO06915.1 NAD(P)/FAD-dependent oxidoreductase [Agrobacterium vitis]UJL91457.1 FAD-dependent oxidoreductase [Agrobacterium vitis]